ncbi:MAG: trigger factor [Acidobacteria bacterium]|nr:trigger factor [Acidobacteriota bacterium]
MTEAKFTNLSETRVRAEIVLAWDAVHQTFHKVLNQLRNKVQIPGFRAGKTPVQMIKSRYKDSIAIEVAQQVIPETLDGIAKQHDVEIMGFEGLEAADYSENNQFSYKILIEVAPQFEIQPWEGVEIEGLEVQVTDADVEEALNYQLENKKKPQMVEKTVEPGDQAVKVNLTVMDTEKGETLSDVEGETISLIEPKGHPALIEHFMGKQPGDLFEVELAADAEPIYPDQAGKPVKAFVEVVGVQHTPSTELNDEFAKDAGYDDLADMKAKTQESMLKARTQQEEDRRESKLLETILKPYRFEIPRSAVFEEAKAMTEQVVAPYRHLLKDNARLQQTVEGLFREYIPMAQFKVKANLVLKKLAKSMGLTVSKEEMLADLEERKAQTDPETYVKVKEAIEEGREGLMFEEQVLTRKTMRKLKESSKVTIVAELTPEPEPQHDHDHHHHDHDHDHHDHSHCDHPHHHHDHDHDHDHAHCDHDHDHEHPHAGADEAVTEEKPKKAAKPRKKATATEAETAEPTVSELAENAEKPKRTRKKTTKKSDPEETPSEG